LSVEPGDEITIEGQHFLMPAGTVSLDCPGGGITTRVSGWSDTRIRATPAAALTKPVESNDCTLIIRDHRGMTAQHDMRLNVIIKRDLIKAEFQHNFSRRRFRMRPSRDLMNGWSIVSSSFKIEPYLSVEEFFWLNQPPTGGRALRGDIEGGLRAGYGRPLGVRKVILEFTIEGPAKLNFYR